VDQPSEFHVELRREEHAAILVLSGELDRHSAPVVDAEVERIYQTDAELLILDLRGLEFMDSTGLRSVILAHRGAEQSGRRLGLVEGSAQVRQLLRWSGLLSLLTVVSDPAELLTPSEER
jgi:stage II sporulation protein AA (anti-sigma F factor antagonist)